ncbi:MAG: hypothetical protein H6636_13970 [Anaerolineales bacterium]|nr:hypothetical protein [Anaerolineales bacterium]
MDNTIPKFWERDFNYDHNKKYKRFDMIWGILWPIIAILIDPGLFRSGLVGQGGLLGGIRLFVYLGIVMSVLTLVVWMLYYQHMKKFEGLFAGIFFTASLFTFVIQILMLPFVLFALISSIYSYGIGLIFALLGILPFLTGLVYLRNGMVATHRARAHHISISHFLIFTVIGSFIILAPSSLIQWRLSTFCNKNIQAILDKESHFNERVDEISLASQRLNNFGYFCASSLDDIVWAYSEEVDPTRKQFLAEIYFEITEEDIEHQLTIVED